MKLSPLLPLLAALFLAGCDDAEAPLASSPTTPAGPQKPPAGQGFSVSTDNIAIAPGDEIQDCYFFRVGDLARKAGLPDNKKLNVHRVQISQREGSHHMNIFRVRTVVNLGPDGGAVQHGKNGQGECFKSPNWADWPLVANTQQDGNLDWEYPDGVVNKFDPDEWLMLQTHYVNASSQKTPDGVGRVDVNFWTVPDDQAKVEMGTLFATKQSIRICQSNPKPVFEGTCQFNSPSPVTIIGANGHFHGRGRNFDMFAWDGKSTSTPPDPARFYSSSTWDDPPMLRSPSLAQPIQPGGGVWYSCGYQWQPPDDSVGCEGLNSFDATKYETSKEDLDCCYTFGPIVEKNEHCNIFVYYYPKVDDVNCF